MVKIRKHHQPRGWAVLTSAGILKPMMSTLWRSDWIDLEKMPATGGCVIAINHISHVDPFCVAHIVHDAGRIPRFLAKDGLFRNKYLGGFLSSAGQVPVRRMSADAVGAFDAAVAAVEAGESVVVYPEGTITKDPDGWPMRGKSGAARIALATGCPVVPIGQWGIQEFLPAYTKKPLVLPRKTHHMKVGDPVDLADLLEQPVTPDVVQEATDRIMAAIASLVGDLRGEPPPPVRFNPRAAGVREIGDPRSRRPGTDASDSTGSDSRGSDSRGRGASEG